ncbi:hypothetical protein BDU57DRAFT_587776 [Ampelomyces quisqualis]|uniref:DUF3632 domain containing protein n=1 Tax=Ampelomyces quisqualis TaxID=50730 RepID=A0A6A5QSH6_AMPQU|nr:hypothetical protein BDU57DRAFT_587776 [Ampelomyces quisqualis]
MSDLPHQITSYDVIARASHCNICRIPQTSTVTTKMLRIEEQNKKVRDIIAGDQDDATKIDAITKVRGWFGPHDNSSKYPIVQDCLDERIKLEEATMKLVTPIDESISAERLDDVDFMDLWYSIIHSARRIHYRDINAHKSLADIVLQFKEHSIPGNEKYNYLYSSLTDFLMASREAYNDPPTPGLSFDLEITAWANLNFFFALLTGKEIADNSLFAIWAMRQALEIPHEDDEQSTALQKYDTYVPAAATWAFGAQTVLFSKEEDLTPRDKKQGNPGRGGTLWTGKAEFSQSRWHFWSERFAEIGMSEKISETTKVVAKDAVEAMERAATFEKM